MERKLDTIFWHEKTANIEIQLSMTSALSKFFKVHSFDINMAKYLNSTSARVDVEQPTNSYVFKDNALLVNDKTKLKMWVDLEIGDKSHRNSTKTAPDDRMSEMLNSVAERDDGSEFYRTESVTGETMMERRKGGPDETEYDMVSRSDSVMGKGYDFDIETI